MTVRCISDVICKQIVFFNAMEQQATPKGDLEVMGVSRSGRVRKKSSKLMDFQSPDEIEPRGKKIVHPKTGQQVKQATHITGASMASPTFGQTSQAVILSTGAYSSGTRSDDEALSTEDFAADENEDSLESDGDSDDMEDENIDDEDMEDNQIDPTVRQSIYMSEKVNKRKVVKDGKAQRKDKGKTRFTAYMLWAKDVRKQMLAQQPDLDFAAISRRLGEMWANVPMSEKCIWKRRAKRLATKSKAIEPKEIVVVKSTSKFLNRSSTNNRTKKASESSHIGEYVEAAAIQLPALTTVAIKNSPVVQVGAYKVTGIDPMDVAAHLRLLGESLSIIGERLKEHEGQITVSGSLSVLLDSLLCSLGPLMCLTTQIPGLEEKNQRLRETLQSTLDNIAYVMPGL